MAKEIVRKEAQRLIEAGAQVLDVLELKEYRESHLPGAIQAGEILMHEVEGRRV
jgi:rhodanese-related sulfurtransferase